MSSRLNSIAGRPSQRIWASCMWQAARLSGVVIRYVTSLSTSLFFLAENIPQAGEYFIENVLRGKGTEKRANRLHVQEETKVSPLKAETS